MQSERSPEQRKKIQEFTERWSYLPADIFTDMLFKEISRIESEDKEPCEHQPDFPTDVVYAVNGYVSLEEYRKLSDSITFPKCKCGAYIKQEGKWVEV